MDLRGGKPLSTMSTLHDLRELRLFEMDSSGHSEEASEEVFEVPARAPLASPWALPKESYRQAPSALGRRRRSWSFTRCQVHALPHGPLDPVLVIGRSQATQKFP